MDAPQGQHFQILSTTGSFRDFLEFQGISLLAEDGEDTERFDRVGVRFVLGALVPLGLGLGGDLYVVLEKVSGRSGLALLGAGGVVVAAFLLWFGLPLLARGRSESAR